MGIVGRFPGMDLEQVQDPVARRNFKTLERILMRAAIGDNPLGATGVSQLGGVAVGGGSSFQLSQVKEGDAIAGSTLGLLGFGKGAEDDLAHAFSVSADGELHVAEFPPVIVSADGAGPNKPFGVSFASQMFTVPRANREANGSSPSNYSILNAGQYFDFNLGSNSGESSTDADVGLCTMDSPKVVSREFSEFGGQYYSGGSPGVAKAMSSGSHSSGTNLAAFRFRHGILSFQATVHGSPTDTMRLLLIGSSSSGGAGAVILKAWQFDSSTWGGDPIYQSHALEFDVDMPFLNLVFVAVGGASDVNNHHRVTASSIYLTFFS